ncbi:MAG TPA: Asp-tRNA(Asn)/Glu-tRNA(Gln) amidotransferase subunit GatA [Candidatus Paceibacterota bacterium]|nr:Asp-tRNA(Asn)/Glu-tRNA(Gln) amidotransferase subunit GatA [Candidatus Paceibacterota bacterium]
MTRDFSTLSIIEAHELLMQKEISVKELVDAFRTKAQEKNAEINAYLELFSDIDEQVAKAQKQIDSGDAQVLCGIPLAIKDNILIKGRKVSAASKILENYEASYDATIIEKLDSAGVVYIGRTNMDEFAMGGSNETSAYGPVKNPYDVTRVPGGSSGGSAASVAMGGAFAALGSDTGGSIRQPASLCGLVGMKPTYGRVSRHGLIAMASSLDQIGPLTRSVSDAKILFEAISGVDPMDSTTHVPETIPTTKHKVLGVPFSLLEKGVDPDVLQNFKDSLAVLEKAGYKIKDISIPSLEYALAVYYVLQPAEASSNLARFDGVKYGLHVPGSNVTDSYFKTRAAGFGKEVKRRIFLGTYVLSAGYYDAYYGKAQEVQKMMTDDFSKVFEGIDAIVTPTSPTPAFKIGEKTADPLAMYLADIFTVSANLTRVPAISVPSGFVEREGNRLPVGIQFMASHFREDILFDVGETFERARN